jgi:hypothetical protein
LASTGRNGWIVAETVVLLTGLFTVLVGLSLLNQPVYAFLVFSTFILVVPSVAVVSFAIWIYRDKVSNKALFGSAALSCCSSLTGLLAIFGIVSGLFFMMCSLIVLNASEERRRVVNN